MGTCISKSKSKLQDPPFLSRESGNPPEEEKVKEVLSEIPRPSVRRPSPVERDPPIPPQSSPCAPEKLWSADEEGVDASEGMSVSQSVMRVATDDGYAREAQGPSPLRSSSGRLNREFSGRRSLSPARRRSDASSETRAHGRMGETLNGMKKGGSGRRSQSSADSRCMTAVNRSGSKKMVAPPCQLPGAAATEREEYSSSRQIDSEDGVYSWENRLKEMKVDDSYGCYAPNETLENPLVSLECFIFL